MVDHCHIGRQFDCPHCFETISVPDAATVNKDKFIEPPGLRRILKEVQDREWEHMRRKLRAAKSQVTYLEKALKEAKETASAREAAVAATAAETAPALEEAEGLRKQLAEMTEKFAQANQAFTAGRKQHDFALEKLRRDLETTREELQVVQKKNDTPAQTLRTAQAELEKSRQQVATLTDENQGLKANLDWARAEVTELTTKLAQSLADVEAEKAKVFLMEAAVGAATPLPFGDPNTPAALVARPNQELEILSGPDEFSSSVDAGEAHSTSIDSEQDHSPKPKGRKAAAALAAANEQLIEEMKGKIAELEKSHGLLRAARDKARQDLEDIKGTLARREGDDDALESAMVGLESGIKEVIWAISARRERKD